MTELRELLVEHFGGTADDQILDLIWEHGDLFQALLLHRLFFPELAEIDGHVVLKEYIAEEGQVDALRVLLRAESPQNALEGYRWREIPYQFTKLENVPDEAVAQLATLMTQSWAAHLATQYPDRRWSASVVDLKAAGGSIGVSFTEAA
jgi:hypothetical protein